MDLQTMAHLAHLHLCLICAKNTFLYLTLSKPINFIKLGLFYHLELITRNIIGVIPETYKYWSL